MRPVRPRLRTVVVLLLAVAVGLGAYWAWSALTDAPAVSPAALRRLASSPSVSSPAAPTSAAAATAPPVERGRDRVLRLHFVRSGAPVTDLAVHLHAVCADPDVPGLVETEADVHTDAQGIAALAGVGTERGIWASSSDRSLSFVREDDSDTVEVTAGRPLRVVVTDAAQRPLAQARVNPEGDLPSCTTDALGQCEVSWPVDRPQGPLDVDAPGYAEKVVQQDLGREVHVELAPERRLTVTVEAPSASLMVPMRLRVEAEDDHLEQKRTIDAPGRFEIDRLPHGKLEVSLAEPDARPIVTRVVPAGTAPTEVTLTLVPRRLDVWIDVPEEPESFPCQHPADVRCAGRARMMIRSTRSRDGRSDFARLEYAPEGPCEVRRGECDGSWQADPHFETVSVSPPGAVTVHAKR